MGILITISSPCEPDCSGELIITIITLFSTFQKDNIFSINASLPYRPTMNRHLSLLDFFVAMLVVCVA